MLEHPVDLLDGVDAAITELAEAGYRLVIVTKGDLNHQERKILASGLADRVERMEIVAEKDPATYRRVVGVDGRRRRRVLHGRQLGASSDVLPVLEIGGRAVHVPYEITWTPGARRPRRHRAHAGHARRAARLAGRHGLTSPDRVRQAVASRRNVSTASNQASGASNWGE